MRFQLLQRAKPSWRLAPGRGEDLSGCPTTLRPSPRRLTGGASAASEEPKTMSESAARACQAASPLWLTGGLRTRLKVHDRRSQAVEIFRGEPQFFRTCADIRPELIARMRTVSIHDVRLANGECRAAYAALKKGPNHDRRLAHTFPDLGDRERHLHHPDRLFPGSALEEFG